MHGVQLRQQMTSFRLLLFWTTVASCIVEHIKQAAASGAVSNSPSPIAASVASSFVSASDECCVVAENFPTETWNSTDANMAFLIGVQKSGTTFLFNELVMRHPKIKAHQMHFQRRNVSIKEPHYFDRVTPGSIDDYMAKFPASSDPSTTFLDATPDYIHVPSAPCRIAKAFPNAKLVVVLKDPVARALSAWNMVKHRLKPGVQGFTEEIRYETHALRSMQCSFEPLLASSPPGSKPNKLDLELEQTHGAGSNRGSTESLAAAGAAADGRSLTAQAEVQKTGTGELPSEELGNQAAAAAASRKLTWGTVESRAPSRPLHPTAAGIEDSSSRGSGASHNAIIRGHRGVGAHMTGLTANGASGNGLASSTAAGSSVDTTAAAAASPASPGTTGMLPTRQLLATPTGSTSSGSALGSSGSSTSTSSSSADDAGGLWHRLPGLPSWNECFRCTFSYCSAYKGGLEAAPLLPRGGMCPKDMGRGFLRRGLYVYQLEWWLKHFPPEQLLVINYEQVQQDPEAVIDRIVTFLGHDPSLTSKRTHKPQGYHTPHNTTHHINYAADLKWLYRFYSHANSELYRLMASLGPASGWSGTFPSSIQQ